MARLSLAGLLMLGLLAALPAAAQSSFTFQGELEVIELAGKPVPAEGEYDFMVSLFDAVVGGSQVGPALLLENVEARGGLFTVQIDFGAVYDGSPLFLEIQVKEAGALGPFQTLSPRRALASAPSAAYSLEAADADTVDGADAFDLTVQNFELVGTELRITEGSVTLSQDLAALISGDNDMDPSDELNTGFEVVGTDLQVSDAGGTLQADLTPLQDGVTDADPDPTNELITAVGLAGGLLELIENGTVTNIADVSALLNSGLSFDGADLSLSDGGGTLQVDLTPVSDGVIDADPDPANELNTALGFDGTSVEVSDAGGTLTADLSSFPVEDIDADPANELIADAYLTNGNDQLDIVEAGITPPITNSADVSPLQNASMSFDGTSLSVTDGGGTLQVDLSALGDDADADPLNELNTGITLNGTSVEVTDAGGTLSADLSTFPVEDADADPTNELISDAYLTNSGGRLEIVEAGLTPPITNAADLTPLQNTSIGFDGTSLSVTDGGGTVQVDLSALADDADANPLNELNTSITLNGTSVEVTDAGGTLSADLSGFPVEDADPDPTNELITDAYLTNGNGELAIIEADLTNTADVSALQNASINFDGTTLSVTDGGGTVSANLSALQDDADSDPANELNTNLSFDGTSVSVSDAGGTLTADLSGFSVNDADADPTNELISAVYLTNGNDALEIVEGGLTTTIDVSPLQNSALSFDGTSVSVTDAGGTLSVDISSLQDDADTNVANELNTSVGFDGTNFTLSDAGGTLTVDLTVISDGTTDADADPANELISAILLTGNSDMLRVVEVDTTNEADVGALLNTSIGFDGTSLSVTDGGGTVQVDLSSLEDDADPDPSNELNTGLALASGTLLQVTDAGGTLQVDLAPLQDGTADADADPTNELISAVYLTNSSATFAMIEAGLTNEVDIAALLNTSVGFDGTSVSVTDGAGTVQADVSSLEDGNTGLALNGTSLEVTDAGGTLSVDLSPIDGSTDLDVLATNELITNTVLTGSLELQLDEGGTVSSVDLSSLVEAFSVPLYDHFGWADASDGSGTNFAGVDDEKVLRVTEDATSSAFEVDFNRIQPGTAITNIPITITEPGFYYLIGNLTNTNDNDSDGIRIDESNVTIDLMGYTLVGGRINGVPSDDGIFVLGTETNIKVRNGGVSYWSGDGIDARSADFSIWTDLHVHNNFGEGLVTDFNNVIERVTAYSNGSEGIQVDDGSVIYQCTAGQNGGNGIQASVGCVVVASASWDNGGDGFAVSSGSTVRNCTASDNAINGFDIGLGSQVTECSAYDNGSNGFDMFSACIVRDCIASLNEGHGILVAANSWIVNNKAHRNDLHGIYVGSGDSLIEGNQVTDNDWSAIFVEQSGSLIIKNTAAGNRTNYIFATNNAFGPVVNVTGSGDISGISNADHPWANFIF